MSRTGAHFGAAMLMMASRVMAGATVALVPGTSGPYTAGQPVSVEVFLTSDEATDVPLRLLQFDFSNTSVTLSPASSLTFDYSSCETSSGLWMAYPGLPRPATVYMSTSENAGFHILLAPSVATLVGTIDVTVNGTGVLDVMNAAELEPALGAKVEFDFCPGGQPSTVWRAHTGELTGGTLVMAVAGETDGCCLPDGTCIDTSPDDCLILGGTSQGQDCAGTGACCLPGGSCSDADLICCDDLGGTESPYASACLGDQTGDGYDEACRTFVFVDADATGPTHDGSSWCEAYLTLQDALAAASAGYTIKVANGTYTPDQGGGQTPGDRNAAFLLIDGVRIEGGYAGCGAPDPDARDIEAYETVLSGDLAGDDTPIACTTDSDCLVSGGQRCVDGFCIINEINGQNSYHVVISIGTNPTAVLDGFTITAGYTPPGTDAGGGMRNYNGSNPTIANCTFTGNTSDFGGGMANDNNCSPTVTNCTFTGNFTFTSGAGMLNGSNSSPTVANCTFSNNHGNGSGGAMDNVTNSNPTITDCIFTDNSTDFYGGGIFNVVSSSPVIIGCTFAGNWADASGGAIHNNDNGVNAPTVIGCKFVGNSAADNGGAIDINSNGAVSKVVNCTFSGNSAETGGGLFIGNNAAPDLVNCSFAGNTAATLGGGISTSSSSPQLSNCVFWRNSDGGGMDESAQIHVYSGTPTVNYSIVQGGWTGAGGTGNSSSDPMLVDPDGLDDVIGTEDDDVRIRVGSPATDAGDNTAVPADTYDLDEDENTTELIPIDLSGNPRFIDDPAVVDTGSGAPPIVDMGAYEQQPPIFVDASATAGNDDGTSWADAYLHLQDALIDAAGDPRGIWVAAGTYMPDGGRKPEGGVFVPGSGDREATFQLLNGVGLYGGFNGTETAFDDRNIDANEIFLCGDLNGDDARVVCVDDAPECDSYGGLCVDGFCIISNNNSENSYHVVTGSGTDATAVLDGLTITAGNDGRAFPDGVGGGVLNVEGSPTVTNCTLNGNSATYGGAMYNISASAPAVEYCTFSGNAAAEGGAIHNFVGSNPTLTGCTFTGNYGWVDGGAIYNDESSPTLTNCTFVGNSTVGRGGAIHNWETSNPVLINCAFSGNSAGRGGGMQSQNASNPTLIDCTFTRNSTTGFGSGGGMHNLTTSSPTLTNCTFRGNTAGGDGGGMYSESGSSPVLSNCTFSGNSARVGDGGGMANFSSATPTLANCTFAGNSAGADGGGLSSTNNSNPTATNCVIWGNSSDFGGSDESAQINDDGTGTLTIDYTLIQGWTGSLGGTGNLGGDPLLVRNPDDGGDGWGDDPATPDVDESANDDYGDLRLQPGSPCIDAADTTAVPGDTADLDNDGDTSERTPYDLDGIPRVIDDPDTIDTGVAGSPVVDMGAYEYYVDCNRNDLPDVCDLDCTALSGTCDLPGCGESVDVDPADGIPDECIEFIGGCDPDIDWSCCDNWNIPGDVYPDNTETESFSPVLDGPDDDVFLDVTVTIDTLDILNGATLSVTQSGTGDLTVVEAGGILAEGAIYVDYDRVISIPNGPLVLSGDAGRYEADPGATGPVSASLTAQQVILLPIAGGRTHQMTLTDSMSVTTTGDFVMEAVGGDLIGCVVPGGRQVDSRGGRTPPITRMRDDSFMSVGANLSLLGAVTFINESTVAVTVSGSFINQSTAPECFDCLNGQISLAGIEPETFEVAGEDLGQAVAIEDAEFAVGTLEVAAETAITFVDTFDNDEQGQGSCTEALYVQDLSLKTGSTIVLDNCRIYYENILEEADVTKIYEGCGALLQYCPMSSPPEPERLTLEFDPESRKIRYLSFTAGDMGQSQAVRVAFSNVPFPYDHWNGTRLWVQQPQVYCENAGVAQADPCPESAGGLPSTEFWGAGLGCDPYATDWTQYDLVHVFNEGIIPGGTYDIQVIDSTCSLDVDDNYSEALTLIQSDWADLVQDCTTTPCKPPDGSTGIIDVTAILDKWKNLPGNVKKVRADIEGSPAGDHRLPDQAINITDVTYCLGAFLGDTYPGPGFPAPSDPPVCP